MKLTIKTLKKGVQFDVDVNEAGTVFQMKEAIQALKASHGEQYPADQQRLIHQGKILVDEKTVVESGVKEGDFVVCMITKGATTAPAAPATTPARTVSTPAPPVPSPTPAPTPVTTSATTTTAPTPTISSPTSTGRAQTSNVASDTAVRSLVDMGFPEDQVRAALGAAFGNPDRAVEYLMNGIPPGVGSIGAGAGTGTGAQQPPVNDPSDPLAQLRSLENFEELRTRVRNNPSELANVLAEIGRYRPELLTAINNNQPAFIALMNQAAETEDMDYDDGGEMGDFGGGSGMPNIAQLAQMISTLNPQQVGAVAQQLGIPAEQLRALASMPPEMLAQMMAGAPGAGGGRGAGGPGGRDPPGVIRVELSEAERAAIDRLVALGFPRDIVLEAFLVCDRNEELTANYLFDSAGGGF